MKKQILITMLVILLVGTISAGIISFNSNTIFDNLDDAKAYAETYSQTREEKINDWNIKQNEEVDKIKLDYKQTTKKICEYDHTGDIFNCYICFELYKPITSSGCVYLEEYSTKKDDDLKILNHIKDSLKFNYIEEDIVSIEE